jgi:hypothetical protein
MGHLRTRSSIDVSRAVRVGVLAVLAALLLLSCEPPVYTTIEWEPDGDGFVQYSTNDPHYYSTAHSLPLAVEHETPMTTVTATVKKMSGSSVGGFGIVFCYQDENNFYRLLITTDGHYDVWEIEGGTWNEQVPWTYTPYLNTGLGVENDIGITKDLPSPGDFTVTLNTYNVMFFTDSSLAEGDAGPCLWVGSYSEENFPEIPEDARFKMDAPEQYPLP